MQTHQYEYTSTVKVYPRTMSTDLSTASLIQVYTFFLRDVPGHFKSFERSSRVPITVLTKISVDCFTYQVDLFLSRHFLRTADLIKSRPNTIPLRITALFSLYMKSVL